MVTEEAEEILHRFLLKIRRLRSNVKVKYLTGKKAISTRINFYRKSTGDQGKVQTRGTLNFSSTEI